MKYARTSLSTENSNFDTLTDSDLEIREGWGGGGGRACPTAYRLLLLLRYFTQNKEGAQAPWVSPLDPPLPY